MLLLLCIPTKRVHALFVRDAEHGFTACCAVVEVWFFNVLHPGGRTDLPSTFWVLLPVGARHSPSRAAIAETHLEITNAQPETGTRCQWHCPIPAQPHFRNEPPKRGQIAAILRPSQLRIKSQKNRQRRLSAVFSVSLIPLWSRGVLCHKTTVQRNPSLACASE